MHYTIQKLIEGNTEVVNYYKRAKEIWDEINQKIDIKNESNIKTLAQDLTHRQIVDFEHDCGGRNIGQEIMAWYGIAQYYTVEDGFGSEPDRLQSAKNVYEAFQRSSCSLEVKSAANDAAKFYDLEEY
jgi:hypothetical protein